MLSKKTANLIQTSSIIGKEAAAPTLYGATKMGNSTEQKT
jgi:hypothetical protein